MSLTDVTPYFQSKMDSLGYKEWQDEYNTDNIPRGQLDKVYHLEVGLIDGSEASHTCFTFNFPVIMTLHSCITGSQGSSKAMEEMLGVVNTVLCNLLAVEERYSQNGFLKIVPVSIDNEPMALSNDNVIRIKIEFGVQVKEEFRLT